jgi:multicomponent Na+:H+ antiporter subunit B
MTTRLRLGLFFTGAAGLAALLAWGLAGLPDFGHYPGPYGDVINRIAVDERHVTSAVAAVVFDYRGFDTLGEEFILFASVAGVALLLREAREDEATLRDLVASEPVRAVGLLAVGPTVLLGLYLVTFGYVTPGGGFQGGIVLAGGLVLVWAAGSYRAYSKVSPTPLVDLAEGVGAGTFPALGLTLLASGAAFLENVFPHGKAGSVLSGGTIPVLNWAAAVAVAAAVVLIVSEFLEELAVPVEEAKR